MKPANYWLRVAWWAVLILAGSAFLGLRRVALLSGQATSFDVGVLAVVAALALAPLFSEVTVLGVTLKREIQKLRTDLTSELLSVRAEVNQALAITNSFSPQIVLPGAAPEATLDAIEDRVRHAHGDDEGAELQVEADPNRDLYAIRALLEKEMRRIVDERQLSLYGPRVLGGTGYANLLQSSGLITPELGVALREAYIICSRALHGDEVTEPQRAFVYDVAPVLLRRLREIAGAT